MRNILRSTTFLAILACWLWSTAFTGVKIGLQYHTPLQFAGIRFFIAGLLILLFWGRPARFFREMKANLKFLLLIGFIQVFVQYSFFYSGLNLIPGSLGAMIIGSAPLFAAIVAHFSFHNDKMTPLKTLSILIGVAGIGVITLGRSRIALHNELEYVGIGLLLLNNIIAGYANVLVAKSSPKVSPVVISSTSLMSGGLLLFLVSVPLEGFPQGPFPARYFFALSWLSFLSAAAISIWYTLLRRPGVKVSLLNVWKFLIPVSGAILSWIILADESPDLMSILGMVIIAISLLALNYSNRRINAKRGASGQ